jgi:cytochrome P450
MPASARSRRTTTGASNEHEPGQALLSADRDECKSVSRAALKEIGAEVPWDFFRRCHEAGEIYWDADSDCWLAAGYHAVKEFSGDDGAVFRRPWEIPGLVRDSTMSEQEWSDFQSLGSTRHIFCIHGAARARQHAWWIQALSPRVLAQWRDELIRPVAERQARLLARRATADLFADFAAVVPPRVTAAILGTPSDEEWITAVTRATVARAGLRQYRGGGTPDPGLVDLARVATRELHELLAPSVEARRTRRAGDLISLLWDDGAALFGEGFDQADVIGAASMVWEAGTWTISLATANALYLLATDPELQRQLRKSDGKVISRFVEESLRLLGPVHARTERVAVANTKLHGTSLRKGDRIIAITGAANRDPDRYVDHDSVRLDRPAPHDHFGFWKGPMICLGQGLSRMQIKVNVEAVVRSLGEFCVDPAKEPPRYAGHTVRGWRPLNVRFDQ